MKVYILFDHYDKEDYNRFRVFGVYLTIEEAKKDANSIFIHHYFPRIQEYKVFENMNTPSDRIGRKNPVVIGDKVILE